MILQLVFLSFAACVYAQQSCIRELLHYSYQGVAPLSRVPVNTAQDCLTRCLQQSDRCKAAIHYKTSSSNGNVCALYAFNSLDREIPLQREADRNGDHTIIYEVMSNCDSTAAVVGSSRTSVRREQVLRTGTGSNGGTSGRFPQSGTWDQWENWAPQCGGGYCGARNARSSQRRTRRCSTYQPCQGENEEARQCECQPAPTWSQWTVWSPCSVTCGSGGEKTRYRTCSQQGACQGDATQTQPCSSQTPCSQWQDWSAWSDCSSSCGNGDCNRQRQCSGGYGAAASNQCQGNGQETKSCSKGPCAEWQQWSEWSGCDKPCGMGQCDRNRDCQGLGECPGNDYDTTECPSSNGPCAEWEEWSAWSSCSKTCGTGDCNRNRECSGYGSCEGQSTDVTKCESDAGPCAQWQDWSNWSQCDKECGTGTCDRNRECTGAGDCKGKNEQSKKCPSANGPCAQWEKWSQWSQSSSTCGQATCDRQRPCSGYGDCKGDGQQTKDCSNGPCAEWSNWAPWSQCSITCGVGGSQNRGRTCSQVGQCQGAATDSKSCSPGPCPSWSEWTVWSPCSASCGGGSRTRTRTCQMGNNCPGDNMQSEPCQEAQCAPQCSWGPWGQYSTCSVTCGAGQQTRRRQCDGCYQCPGGSPTQSTPCQMGPCTGYASEQYQQLLAQRRQQFN